VVVLRTDDDLQPITEFYDRNGTLVQSLLGVRTDPICHRYALSLKKNDLFAFADQSGDPLTDYIYSFVMEVSGGREYIHYPYAIAKRADTGSKELIDVRTGKNAITENAAVSGYEEIIEEGNYFPFYVDGKTGVARLTVRGESPFRDVGESSWYTEAVKFCYNAGLMSGMGEGEFGPKVTMNRAMLVSVLYRISGEKTASHGFTDVPEGKWYTDAVNWAASLGIVSGKTETSFCPKDPVTREQMVTILYNYACLFGEQAADLSLLDSFEDAGRVGNYARTPMAWAVGVGVISGRTPTTLDPKGNATRAEIASILMRFIRYMAA
jgi:hypothetical protein